MSLWVSFWKRYGQKRMMDSQLNYYPQQVMAQWGNLQPRVMAVHCHLEW